MEELENLLTAEEREKPMLVLEQLFDACDLAFYQLELWELLKAAMSADAWSFLQSPGMAPRFGESLNRLMAGCLLLLQQHEQQHGEIALPGFAAGSAAAATYQRQQLMDRDRIRFSYFGLVNRLSTPEIEEPLLAVKAFFSYAGIASWKAVVAEWVEGALHAFSIMEALEDDVLLQFQYFQQLLEAAWLLLMRSHPRQWEHFVHQQFAPFAKAGAEERIVSRPLFEAFHALMKAVPALRLNRNLRKLLIGYLQGNQQAFPPDFEDYLTDLEFLTDFLDVAERETKGWHHEGDVYGGRVRSG